MVLAPSSGSTWNFGFFPTKINRLTHRIPLGLNCLPLMYMEKHHFQSLVIFFEIALKHFTHSKVGGYRVIGVHEWKFENF